MLQVVWLKRDLRLRDHQPIVEAAKHGPMVLVYCFEPALVKDPHYSERHWRFVSESLDDLNKQLLPFDTSVLCFYRSALNMLSLLHDNFGTFALRSYQEVGIARTYERDKAVAIWCKANRVPWYEASYSGVRRGLKNRNYWYESWHELVEQPCHDQTINSIAWAKAEQLNSLANIDERDPAWRTPHSSFQKGGEHLAWYTLKDFVKERGKDYSFKLSSPSESRTACSRLSPYLAWGNISPKQVYQFLNQFKDQKAWRRTIAGVQSRLQWRDHFIQKFESEPELQTSPMNAAYQDFPYIDDEQEIRRRLDAWRQGKTGIPLIDACMRCVNTTGYLNFRMRAMLISFLCHQLNIDWRLGSAHLAAQFLDFEPGIHYPQFQMQAGVTGINAIRLYNPLKQAKERDPESSFISKWLPELSSLPAEVRGTVNELSVMEQTMHGFDIKQHYYEAVIDLNISTQEARDRLWAFQKQPSVRAANIDVLKRHTIPDRARMLNMHS